MKRSKKKAKAVLPVIISVGICATSVGVSVNALPQVAYASSTAGVAGAQAVSANNAQAGELPPVRTSLTKEEAEQMAGCEAYFDQAKHEFVIRPKNGANEGVISYSIANKKDDFEAIRHILIFEDPGDDVPVRFDKRVYIYGSTNASANDTLFYQTHVKTINITDNLSIKFAKDLAKFFMQNYNKAADHLHYIKGIENWDTSNIESMEKMFNLASQLEGKIDLSHWNVSNTDNFELMFSGVGNDNFILDFSNKNFKNAANVKNMFNSFGGVLVANNWTTVDPNGENPIQKLLDGPDYMLTYYDTVARKYTGQSKHLLITDNPTILTKNQTAKYKFYKKVKVIYKVNGTEKSAELELPAVYDSRIDADGKPDASKAASNDPMQVVRPQIDDAIKQAVKDLRDQNPSLKLPENVIPVPVHDLKDAKSPIELFQDYYLGLVKEEVTKAKTTYTADPKLEYKKVEYDTQPQDGKKQVITGAMKDGAWDPDATSEKEITKAVDGKARVGNKEVKTEEIQPDTKYEADGTLDYKKELPTEGTKGTKTTTTIYKVDENTGLTNNVQSSESKTTTPAKDKVIKVGNVKTETEVIKFKTTYVADDTLAYEAKEDKTAGKDGSKTVTTKYKVDKTNGLSADVESTQEKKVDPTDHVVRVGNKQVTHEGDKTITTTYDVDPNTGKLTNPKKHTSMPWGNVTPADQLQKTVTFKNSDDSQITSVKVETGKAIATDNLPDQSMPANPTKDGFKFKEWNTKQDGTGSAFNADTVVNNDLTVYAVYTKNPVTPPQPKPPVQNQKTVTFNKKDGSLLSTVKVETGKKVAAASMPAAPVEEGFTFKEWNTKQDGTGAKFNADTVVNNDLTVYAIYTKNPVTPQPPTPTPQPGQHDNSEPAVLDTQDAEVLPGKMKYEADETLPYNTQKKIKDPVDGLKITTHTGKFVNGKWEPSEKVTTTPAQNGLTKVGNKQVTHEGDKTITITYDVDPDTGKLTNPKKHISMPQAVLEAASPAPTATNEPSKSTTSEKSGRAAGHIVAKTGETPSFANMLAGIGLAIAGFITGLHKKKKEDK